MEAVPSITAITQWTLLLNVYLNPIHLMWGLSVTPKLYTDCPLYDFTVCGVM